KTEQEGSLIMLYRKLIIIYLLIIGNLLIANPLHAQKDTIGKKAIDSIAFKRKNFLRKLAQNLMVDTSKEEGKDFQRNDLPFQPFEDRIIRKVTIEPVDFGVNIRDTSKHLKNTLIHLADFFHHKTRNFVVGNNLFFKTNQKLSPYLLGSNERFLRDL